MGVALWINSNNRDPDVARRTSAARCDVGYSRGMDGSGTPPPADQKLVDESWERSRLLGVDPVSSAPQVELEGADLSRHVAGHRMASVLPVVESVLVPGVVSGRHIVAVADERGRLLRVIGDRGVRSRAESMAFIPGAVWTDEAVGANAPGLALKHDTEVRVRGSEHYLELAQAWSCTAAPVHDPATGELIGLIDVTGPSSAASDQMLALVRATAMLAEGELRTAAGLVVPRRGGGDRPGGGRFRLHALGPEAGLVREIGVGGAARALTGRHAEICVLLDAHPEGLSGGALAELLADDRLDEVSVRAEVSRLRRVFGPGVVLSRPYRLTPGALVTDVREVMDAIDAGDAVRAVSAYPGPVLPASDAPGVADLRLEVHAMLRALVLSTDRLPVLRAWVAGAGRDDLAAWRSLARSREADAATVAAAEARCRVLDHRFGA